MVGKLHTVSCFCSTLPRLYPQSRKKGHNSLMCLLIAPRLILRSLFVWRRARSLSSPSP
jgi:hypothetical protein